MTCWESSESVFYCCCEQMESNGFTNNVLLVTFCGVPLPHTHTLVSTCIRKCWDILFEIALQNLLHSFLCPHLWSFAICDYVFLYMSLQILRTSIRKRTDPTEICIARTHQVRLQFMLTICVPPQLQSYAVLDSCTPALPALLHAYRTMTRFIKPYFRTHCFLLICRYSVHAVLHSL